MGKSPWTAFENEPFHPHCLGNAGAWLARHEIERALPRSGRSLGTDQGPNGLRVVARPEHATFGVGQRDCESHGAGVFAEDLSPRLDVEKLRPYGLKHRLVVWLGFFLHRLRGLVRGHQRPPSIFDVSLVSVSS